MTQLEHDAGQETVAIYGCVWALGFLGLVRRERLFEERVASEAVLSDQRFAGRAIVAGEDAPGDLGRQQSVFDLVAKQLNQQLLRVSRGGEATCLEQVFERDAHTRDAPQLGFVVGEDGVAGLVARFEILEENLLRRLSVCRGIDLHGVHCSDEF